MNHSTSEPYYLPRWLRSWEQFWFTPADPSVLALIRIVCGVIVVYTLFAYSFNLQAQMGEHAWHDLKLRLEIVRDRPVNPGPLTGLSGNPAPVPSNDFEANYYRIYQSTWGDPPPAPYPTTVDQAEELDRFRRTYGIDLRAFGLRPPVNEAERAFVEKATSLSASVPKMPPATYPKDAREEKEVLDYLERWGSDPRTLYDRGANDWSLWFHVTNPRAMAILHGLFIAVAVLFTIGFCTRITAALTWFTNLCYIQRNPTMLFGADTMMLILLLYLMIGPSGAVLSVDRLIARWWTKAKPGWVRWWYGLIRRPLPETQAIAPAALPEPEPTVSANFALRLLQIHVCIIYLIAGLSKLQGPAWWQGTALWGTVANYEFAPMRSEWYLSFLRFLGGNQLYLNSFTTFGGLFALAFEISYAFLIWRPRMRWLYLGSAIVLHGGIGVFMGLKTFAILMLVMNMAFLRPDEIAWMLRFFTLTSDQGSAPAHPEPAMAAMAAGKKKG